MLGPLRRSLAVLVAVPLLAATAPALANTGGTSVPVNPPTVPLGQDGGIPAGADVEPMKVPAPPKKRAQMPTLTSFTVGASRFSDDGRGLPIVFAMSGTTGVVHVSLGVYHGGRRVAALDLGRRATGATQRYLLNGRSAKRLPAGRLVLRLSGHDARGHHLRARLQASAAHVVTVSPPAPNGGALQRMLPPFRMGVGGRLGDGRHWMPWIHLEDLAGIFEFALRNPVRGALNGAAPNPVTNAEFTRALGQALHRPTLFPVPAGVLRLVFGQVVDEAILASARVLPAALVESGYRFRHSTLAEALAHVLGTAA